MWESEDVRGKGVQVRGGVCVTRRSFFMQAVVHNCAVS